MRTVSYIKYADAHYGYDLGVGEKGTLPVQEAYGYVEEEKESVLIHFIKRVGGDEKGEIIKGLIVPRAALLSGAPSDEKQKPLASLQTGKNTEVTWQDVTYAANIPRRTPSIMCSQGILKTTAKDHIVLANPKTVRLFPKPKVSHPEKPPAFYRIPMSVITHISQS